MPSNAAIQYPRFQGLTNVGGPLGVGIDQLQRAPNFYLTNNNDLKLRHGMDYLLDADFIFTNSSKTRLYVIQSGDLYFYDGALSLIVSSVGAAPYHYCMVSDLVFFSSATKNYIINDTQVRAWGVPQPSSFEALAVSGNLDAGDYRVSAYYTDKTYGYASGAITPRTVTVGDSGGISLINLPISASYDLHIIVSRASGSELYYHSTPVTDNIIITNIHYIAKEPFDYVNYSSPVPDTIIGYYDSRVYIAVYDPAQNFSVAYASAVNAYHLFSYRSVFDISELGRILFITESPRGLIIGKENEVVLYRFDENGRQDRRVIFNYGVTGEYAYDYDNQGNLWIITRWGIIGITPENILTPLRNKFNADWGTKTNCSFVVTEGTEQLVVVPIDNGFLPTDPVSFDIATLNENALGG